MFVRFCEIFASNHRNVTPFTSFLFKGFDNIVIDKIHQSICRVFLKDKILTQQNKVKMIHVENNNSKVSVRNNIVSANFIAGYQTESSDKAKSP